VAGETLLAGAAEDGEAADDVIARLNVGDLVADGLDDAGGLVAEDGGGGMRVGALYEVEVAVADAAGGGADDDLVGDRLVELDVLDREGLLGAVEEGGFHGRLLVVRVTHVCLMRGPDVNRATLS
jgi:hypothetical protein